MGVGGREFQQVSTIHLMMRNTLMTRTDCKMGRSMFRRDIRSMTNGRLARRSIQFMMSRANWILLLQKTNLRDSMKKILVFSLKCFKGQTFWIWYLLELFSGALKKMNIREIETIGQSVRHYWMSKGVAHGLEEQWKFLYVISNLCYFNWNKSLWFFQWGNEEENWPFLKGVGHLGQPEW